MSATNATNCYKRFLFQADFIKLKYFDFSVSSSADATWVNYTSDSLFSLETSSWSVKHTTSWEPKTIYPMKEQAVTGCILEQLL